MRQCKQCGIEFDETKFNPKIGDEAYVDGERLFCRAEHGRMYARRTVTCKHCGKIFQRKKGSFEGVGACPECLNKHKYEREKNRRKKIREMREPSDTENNSTKMRPCKKCGAIVEVSRRTTNVVCQNCRKPKHGTVERYKSTVVDKVRNLENKIKEITDRMAVIVEEINNIEISIEPYTDSMTHVFSKLKNVSILQKEQEGLEKKMQIYMDKLRTLGYQCKVE